MSLSRELSSTSRSLTTQRGDTFLFMGIEMLPADFMRGEFGFASRVCSGVGGKALCLKLSGIALPVMRLVSYVVYEVLIKILIFVSPS